MMFRLLDNDSSHGVDAEESGSDCQIAIGCPTKTIKIKIRKEHFKVLKDNALLANAGHFWEEIDVDGLSGISKDRKQMRTNVEGFLLQDGRWLNLLGNGNIVNIACADGHPAEIMDTSFALQALSAQHLVRKEKQLANRCYPVPERIDQRVAQIRLESSGVSFDTLTEDQQQYLSGWDA